MSSDSKTYCPVMFDEIYSSNKDDSYNLCCYATGGTELDKKFKQSTHSPFEFFLSDEMNDLRSKVLKGEKIRNCHRCYREEERHGYSSRTKYIDEYKNGKGYLPIKVERLGLKLRHFGNYCNLSCVMCNPWNSTTRKKELEDTNTMRIVTEGYQDFYYENLDFKSYEKFKQSILDNIHLIDRFFITGGEPLQMPKVWQFLMKDIPDEHAKNIKILFDTNGTKMQYKNYDFLDIVKKFKKAQMNISCDNIGDKLAFQRYPIDVEEFENNLLTYNKYINQIQITVSLLNVLDLDNIYNYYKDNYKLDVASNSYVEGPTIMSVINLKNNIKKDLINKYSYLKENNKLFYNELKKTLYNSNKDKILNYLDTLSKHRNMNWRSIWGDQIINSLV